MKFSIPLLLIFLLFGAYSTRSQAQGYSFGYRLDYATSKLDATKIAAALPEFKSGHTSAFFFRKFFTKEFYLETAPGAWNSEEGNAQFTFQYNTLGAGYQAGDIYIFDVGANIGAGLFVISNAAQPINEIQTNATVLRKDAAFYTVQAGAGRNWEDLSVLLNLRYFGFFDSDLSKLDNLAAGISIAVAL